MAKLILSLDNAFLSEHQLDQERITIGRRSSNDIQVDNLAVSGEHAAIIKMGNDFYIEDLESTNGTFVNSKSVKKHLLQHADLVEFGKYQFKYINETMLSNTGVGDDEADFEKTMIIRSSAIKAMEEKPLEVSVSMPKVPSLMAATTPAVVAEKPPVTPVVAPAAGTTSNSGEIAGRIQVLNGSSSGRELLLNKALTTLGKPGVQVAVITKRPSGYFITHVEGQVFPIVNGASTGAQAFALNDHDVIELAGVKMGFYLSKS